MQYVEELYAMMRVKWRVRQTERSFLSRDEDLRFCYDILRSVSRSFALVIMQLSEELRDAVCVFYLVLRALDTIEDDMSLDAAFKRSQLPRFHEKLRDVTWRLDGVGAGRERELLENFPHVTRAYSRLAKKFQGVIAEICARMGGGMADFLSRPVATRGDYDLYCHYVAGLVGHGLTRLFVASGLEHPQLAAGDLANANHMGLFLQKTNIIRDYYEDIEETPPRVFWPREIWGKYAADLGAFKQPEHEAKALECLNAMVADALVHVPYVVEYMASLRDPTVFAFCAVPQVMAMATLSLVVNNRDVFHKKVKVSRGATARIFHYSTDLEAALKMMKTYAESFTSSLNKEDVCYEKISTLVSDVGSAIDAHLKPNNKSIVRAMLTCYPALGGVLLYKLVDNVVTYFGKE